MICFQKEKRLLQGRPVRVFWKGGYGLSHSAVEVDTRFDSCVKLTGAGRKLCTSRVAHGGNPVHVESICEGKVLITPRSGLGQLAG